MSVAFWGGLVFLVFASWMLWRAWRAWGFRRASEAWPAVEGEVLDQMLALSPTGVNVRHFSVRYAYRVDGVDFTGNRVAWYTLVRKEQVEPLAERFVKGARVDVFVRPGDAATACLVTGGAADKPYSDLVLAGLGVAVGLGLTVASALRVVG